eukprot:TRINITY_DN9920_c0_g1_i1.p1 TRINITY_DN9920_c0_g1~~TRINITY_DN9920_c0_g1_i1.p1  ORF type:complete len:324 (-),score=33.36 TRINITY_DN9920_c0_g1_i1:16-987(-)
MNHWKKSDPKFRHQLMMLLLPDERWFILKLPSIRTKEETQQMSLSSSTSIIWKNQSAQQRYESLEEVRSKIQTSVDDAAATRRALVHIEAEMRLLSLEYNQPDYSAQIGFALGFLFMLGVNIIYWYPSLLQLGAYLTILSTFHFMEYNYVWKFHPKLLSHDSFLLNHSTEYIFAMSFSFVEFLVEWYFLPWLKLNRIIMLVGIILSVGGQILRSVAMWTAGSNFHHLVREQKEEGHTLVTDGIYQYFRHPSYVGHFYWAVGTQLFITNPICTLAFAYYLWNWFNDRITREEKYLIKENFGDAYIEYKKHVGAGLPGIVGYQGK